MMDVEVVLVDERLTTVMAQNQLIFADVINFSIVLILALLFKQIFSGIAFLSR